jgi:tetratricopeptide (TPR) repeat protein
MGGARPGFAGTRGMAATRSTGPGVWDARMNRFNATVAAPGQTALGGFRTGTFAGSRTGTLAGARTGTFTGTRTGTFTGTRTGTFTGTRTGTFAQRQATFNRGQFGNRGFVGHDGSHHFHDDFHHFHDGSFVHRHSNFGSFGLGFLLGRSLGFPFWYGFGYPWFGYGLGYGYPWYGDYGYGGYGYSPYYTSYNYYYGYPDDYYVYGGYPYYDSYSSSLYDYGYPYGYGASSPYDSSAAGYSPDNYGGYTTAYTPATAPDATQLAAADPALRAELDFRSGNYQSAVTDLQQALQRYPNNGVVMMMLAQAQFATGQYQEAARMTEQAMQLLPPEQWGVVVSNFRELYTNVQDYTRQLRALEQQAKNAPSDPTLRFLLGFQYYFLGYPREAAQQLDEAAKLAPDDSRTHSLRALVAARLGTAPTASTRQPPPALRQGAGQPPSAGAALPGAGSEAGSAAPPAAETGGQVPPPPAGPAEQAPAPADVNAGTPPSPGPSAADTSGASISP